MRSLLFFLVVIIAGCSSESVRPSSFTYTYSEWVEATTQKDTLIFDNNIIYSRMPMLIIKSDKEIEGYNDLHVASYQFELKGTTIALQNLLSSCYCPTEYPFMFDGKRIRIGNFYDTSGGAFKTFVRLD